MAWLLLAVFAAVAAALVLTPRLRWLEGRAPAPESAALRAERGMLLAELRDLDEDAAAGRITAADRIAGRRALAPRLRAVTEALHAAGERRAQAGERS